MKRLAWIPCFFLSGLVSAQQPSHLNDIDDPLPNLAKFFESRRGGKTSSNPDADLLRKLIRNIPPNIDPNQIDPKFIERVLQRNPELKDPKNLERMRQLIDEQMRDRPNPTDPKIDWKNLEQTVRNLEEIRKKELGIPIEPNPPKMPDPPPANPPPKTPPPEPKTAEPKEELGKEVDSLSNWLVKNFGDSPATLDIIKDFADLMKQGGPNEGLDHFLKDFGNEWKSLIGTPDGNAGAKLSDLFAGLKLPDLGSSGPTDSPLVGSADNLDASNSGAAQTASRDGMSGGTVGLLVLALVALAGYFYWSRIVKRDAAAKAKELEPLPLVWPIEPQALATRADVVKAFDFLSVAKCGEDAINWHHRQIAGTMMAQAPDKREAVDRLAWLYERARYAPSRDEFTDLDIAEARARFCQLAGVSLP